MSDRGSTAFDPHSFDLPWIDSPFFAQLLEAAEIPSETKKLVRHFADYGYVIIDPEVPTRLLDAASREVAGRFEPGGDGYYSDEKRIQDAWNFSDAVRGIATAPRILQILEILYGRRPFPFQTLNFRVGSEQRTHSDIALFDSIPHGFMCGVWVALEEIDESNGPLHYYPTSHKLPLYNLHDLGVVASAQTHALENYTRYEDFVEALIKTQELPRQELRVQKGEALIWAANLYHGGCPIFDKSRTRFSQVTHYYFAGCLYYTPLLSDPGLGRLSPRTVFNAEVGRMVPQYYHGQLVENPGEWPPRLSGLPPILSVTEFPTRVPRKLESILTKPIDLLRKILK